MNTTTVKIYVCIPNTHTTETFRSGKYLVHCQSATITVIQRHSHANTIGLINESKYSLAYLLCKKRLKKMEIMKPKSTSPLNSIENNLLLSASHHIHTNYYLSSENNFLLYTQNCGGDSANVIIGRKWAVRQMSKGQWQEEI